jgi:hypothetical protein
VVGIKRLWWGGHGRKEKKGYGRVVRGRKDKGVMGHSGTPSLVLRVDAMVVLL